jgi:hypothetical protein
MMGTDVMQHDDENAKTLLVYEGHWRFHTHAVCWWSRQCPPLCWHQVAEWRLVLFWPILHLDCWHCGMSHSCHFPWHAHSIGTAHSRLHVCHAYSHVITCDQLKWASFEHPSCLWSSFSAQDWLKWLQRRDDKYIFGW